MLFHSPEFVFVFLPLALLGYFGLQRYGGRGAVGFLVLASLAFYSYWNLGDLGLLCASIVFNYIIGTVLGRTRRRSLLFVGVAANLTLLAYYKYAGWLGQIANDALDAGLPAVAAALPLAISFYTFLQIAWLVDNYRGEVDGKSGGLLRYTLFVTFFPHLIAGPLVHHREMMPQFDDRKLRDERWAAVATGLFYFVVGLAKKLVVADAVAPWANQVFDAAAAGATPGVLEAWSGAIAYTLQIYYDFSGYADMAVGLGLMFNIRLPVNFNSPYQARSISGFWRRWHITLSRFLRDYVYIPLGGNRRGPYRRQLNVLLTMVLGGLWHGANWTFLVWGALHGGYLTIQQLWTRFSPVRLPAAAARGITLLAVIIAWVFFRAASWDAALRVLKGMFVLSPATAVLDPGDWTKALVVGVPALMIALFGWNTQWLARRHVRPLFVYPESRPDPASPAPALAFTWRWAAYSAVLAAACIWLMLDDSVSKEFIYFRF